MGSWHAAAPHDLLDILLLKSFVESPTDSLPAIQIPQDDYCFEIIIQVLQVLPMHALLETFEALQANLCFKKKTRIIFGQIKCTKFIASNDKYIDRSNIAYNLRCD